MALALALPILHRAGLLMAADAILVSADNRLAGRWWCGF